MKKTAFLFPGQGAQNVGMGKDFAENYSSARHVFEEADDLLKRNLSKIIWEGPDALLTETRNSQVGIYVTSMAILRVLTEQFPKLKPAYCAGLSLGEYSALTASGKLSFQETLMLVDKRGQYMNDACEAIKGTMAVVMGMESAAVEQMVQEINLPHDLWVANLNCPGQVVISGTAQGIEAASKVAKEKGAKRVLPLAVHGAFHSGLMAAAEKRLEPEINEVKLVSSPTLLVMNYSGNLVSAEKEMRHQLIKQVTSPVRWEQGIRKMDADDVNFYLEIGCGKTLAGMNKRIGTQGTTFSLEKVAELAQLEAIL
jgi:[acyl-carrier-protein] S-malonyltransferase